MKVSYTWLQKYFDKPLPAPEKIAEAITFHAFEIDGIEKKDGDSVLDVKVLPDRAHDCLSHRGIAKEISVITKIPLGSDPLAEEVDLSKRTNSLAIVVAEPKLCPRYAAALIRGVEVKASPRWLKERLEALGQRSVNNVVDATNFVMFNIGQPLHAFDAGKMQDSQGKYAISVRLASRGESITTLDGKKYDLTDSMLLITDGNAGEAIAIAGIKGGRPAEVDGSTKDILIESANFNAVSTRKTSQALKLRTDASMRFENDLSPEFVGFGLTAAVNLILKLAGGELEGYVDEYFQPQETHAISVSRDQANQLLGTKMSNDEIESIIKRFGYTYEIENDMFHIAVPFERLDLRTKEDVIAELGRVYGYENIPTMLPEPMKGKIEINSAFYYADKIRSWLSSKGFSEVYTSVFATEGERAVQNKVESDTPFLRTSLIPALSSSAEANFRNKDLLGVADIRLFELGTVWTKKEEKRTLAVAVRGGKKSPKAFDILKELLADLGADHSASLAAASADQVLEIDFDALVAKLPKPKSYEKTSGLPQTRYVAFSHYPFVLRDIALWVPEDVSAQEVEKTILKQAGELLVRNTLFDEFKKEGKISYAFRLVFQSFERTLSDDEVNQIMEKVGKALEKKQWQVR